MIFQKYHRKGSPFICALLVAAILMQLFYFPAHTAYAVEETEAEITPGTTTIKIDNERNTVTFYIGSGIALRMLAAKINNGDFADLDVDLQVILTANIDLSVPATEAEVQELNKLIEYTAGLGVSNSDSDIALLNAIQAQLSGGDTSWTPMGTSTNPFVGNFDGCGHTISMMNIMVSDVVPDMGTDEENGAGEPSDSEPINEPSDNTGDDSGDGTTENDLVTELTGNVSHVGFIGYLYEGGVQNLTVDGNITVTTETVLHHVGMIVGSAEFSLLNNCKALGTIDVRATVPEGENSDLLMTMVGGVAGQALCSIIFNCGNETTIYGENLALTGGIAGALMAEGSGDVFVPCILNSYSVGAISGTAAVCGGLVGYASGNSINNYFNGQMNLTQMSSGISGIDNSYGTHTGLLTNIKDISVEPSSWEYLDLELWYNYVPSNYSPELPPPPDENTGIPGIIGGTYVSGDLPDKLTPYLTTGQVLATYDNTAPQTLCDSLNNQLLLIKLVMMQYVDILANSPLSDLVSRLNSDQIKFMCWTVGAGGYPVQTPCTYEASGTSCASCGRGDATAKETYNVDIATADQLLSLAVAVNVAGNQLPNIKLSVRLVNDIDLEGRTWTPMGTWDNPFTGNFDGCGHTISNMSIEIVDEKPLESLDGSNSFESMSDFLRLSKLAGFIGCMMDSGVQNLTIENGNVDVYTKGASYNVGMIAGYMKNSLLNNCTASGRVSVATDPIEQDNSGNNTAIEDIFTYASVVGGLVGQTARSIIINCGSNADVHGEYIMLCGGLAGSMMTMSDGFAFCLFNSYCTGKMTGHVSAAGGLVALANDSMVNNYFAGQMDMEVYLYDSSSSSSIIAFGSLFALFTDDDIMTDGEQIADLEVWYNHFPNGYIPNVTYTYVDSETEETVEVHYGDIMADSGMYPVIGTAQISDGTAARLEGPSEQWQVVTPYAITASSDPGRDYTIRDAQTLADDLNAQLTLTNQAVDEHRYCLEDSEWGNLVENMNGDAVLLMCWSVGDDGYPVLNPCVYETSGGTQECPICGRGAINTGKISSVEITWGNMAFEYVDSAWEPINTNGNLLTIRNTGETYVNVGIIYTPVVTEVLANLEIHVPTQGSAVIPDIASESLEAELPPPAPEYGWTGKVTAYLLLEGEPSRELNNEPLGTITITITEPKTEITKWGHQHESEADPESPAQIYWTVQITGSENSQIPGNVLTDECLAAAGGGMGDHEYTDADIAAGLTIGASKLNPETGVEEAWYSWEVSTDPYSPDYDPNLTWTSTGWSYKIPYSIGSVSLGNEGWVYFVNYTSTTIPTGIAGIFGHMNRVSIDGQSAEAWVGIEHSESHGNIVSFGELGGDGIFRWDVKAIIPGIEEGQKADYLWYIMDYMEIRDGYNVVGYIHNDADTATVTAAYDEATTASPISVPHISVATENDPFAWNDHWTAESGGIEYGKHLDLLSRCHCTAETCTFWSEETGCDRYYYEVDGEHILSDFCHCWTAEGATTFTFSFETNDPTIIDTYGGNNYKLYNRVELWNQAEMTDGVWEGVLIDTAQASILIE